SVEPDRPIPLRVGWSMVAYFPEEPVYFETTFANIDDIEEVLRVVKDAFGRFWLPRWHWGNLGDLERGMGYKVKVSEEIEFVWNTEERVMATPSVQPEPVHFVTERSSGDNMSVLVISGPGVGVLADALVCQSSSVTRGRVTALDRTRGRVTARNYDIELGCFTETGICVGAVVLDGSDRNGFAIWADDPTNNKVDGATDDAPLMFKLWDGSNEMEVVPVIESGESLYRTDDVLVISLDKDAVIPVEFGLTSLYPNPFNSVLTIGFTLDRTEHISLKLYNLTGREVGNLLDDVTNIGHHSLSWDASEFPSGLYFVRLEAGNRNKTAKIALVR
ncbi:MAG: T9SS type A sorting domain-containing protein, partial [Candidatus Electryoneaceae bacterium]|nr:T9SS type A sorting domain-containing protein [Candidatus Electryoneaceae bacterium]